jgi:hypothetical protein
MHTLVRRDRRVNQSRNARTGQLERTGGHTALVMELVEGPTPPHRNPMPYPNTTGAPLVRLCETLSRRNRPVATVEILSAIPVLQANTTRFLSSAERRLQ